MHTHVHKNLLYLIALMASCTAGFAQNRTPALRVDVPLDSIRLSDPFILADRASSVYYMTGTGGMIWKSRDLKKWTGPFWVAKTDTLSWMGKNPMIWAAELHAYKGKYYY